MGDQLVATGCTDGELHLVVPGRELLRAMLLELRLPGEVQLRGKAERCDLALHLGGRQAPEDLANGGVPVRHYETATF